MDLQKVKSSLLAAVLYDAEKKVLHVEFIPKKGQEKRSIYSYSDVSPEKYAEMMAAKSIGSYFLKSVKPNHQFTRIEEEYKCDKCGKEKAQDVHICPYKREINDDEETTCNCCETCQQNCSDDI